MWYWTKLLILIFAGAVLVWLTYEVITFPSIGKLRTENPTTTSMIEFADRRMRVPMVRRQKSRI